MIIMIIIFSLIGATKGSVPEAYKAANDGPTEAIRLEIDLNTLKKEATIDDSLSPSDISSMIPNSSGRWLHRRKNDGALNRMPPKFYSRAWRVLERSAGFKIYDNILPNKPTVYEKTPEEFSFALLMENFLGYIADPAQRQIAVETIMTISRINSRNPEVEIVLNEYIDLTAIIRSAVETFWKQWVTDNAQRWEKNFKPEDLTFEKNKALARRLFYDLPQDGREGTYAYLSRSIFKVLRYDVDFSADSCNNQ